MSPRLVAIVTVLEQMPSNPGNGVYPITAFAGFFITGCDDERSRAKDDVMDDWTMTWIQGLRIGR